ncbi:MAG: tetratricopeptide repeat protein [Gemmatimonadetes bacterium]|nr:tetratricopeptide repeat protein [Gemmatimonadota bacterium]
MTKTGEAARPMPSIEPETLGETWLLYQKQIIIGAIVVAVGAGGFWLWSRSSQIKEEKAGVAFQSAEATFMSGNKFLAQAELEKITSRYKGTTAGTQAAMLTAQVMFEQGKHAEGIAQLEAVAGSAPKALRAGIQALIGSGLESSGKPAEAAAAFAKAASEAGFAVDRDMHHMEQARNLIAANDVAGASKIYKEISGREDSPFAGEAKVHLGEVSAKP